MYVPAQSLVQRFPLLRSCEVRRVQLSHQCLQCITTVSPLYHHCITTVSPMYHQCITNVLDTLQQTTQSSDGAPLFLAVPRKVSKLSTLMHTFGFELLRKQSSVTFLIAALTGNESSKTRKRDHINSCLVYRTTRPSY